MSIEITMRAIWEGECECGGATNITELAGTTSFLQDFGGSLLYPTEIKKWDEGVTESLGVDGSVTAVCGSCKRVWYAERIAESGDWAD